MCENPIDVQCETAFLPHYSAAELGQTLTCDTDVGLECQLTKSQPLCFDYRIRFLCCKNVVSDPNCLSTPSLTTHSTTKESSTTQPSTEKPLTTQLTTQKLVTTQPTTEKPVMTQPTTEKSQTTEHTTQKFLTNATTISTTPATTEAASGTTKTVGTTRSDIKNPTLPPITYPTYNGCGRVQSKTPTVISFNNCTTVDPIYLNECQGKCSSSQAFTQMIDGHIVMDERCSCCRAEQVIQDIVELQCPDGTTLSINVPYIETCACNEMDCHA